MSPQVDDVRGLGVLVHPLNLHPAGRPHLPLPKEQHGPVAYADPSYKSLAPGRSQPPVACPLPSDEDPLALGIGVPPHGSECLAAPHAGRERRPRRDGHVGVLAGQVAPGRQRVVSEGAPHVAAARPLVARVGAPPVPPRGVVPRHAPGDPAAPAVPAPVPPTRRHYVVLLSRSPWVPARAGRRAPTRIAYTNRGRPGAGATLMRPARAFGLPPARSRPPAARRPPYPSQSTLPERTRASTSSPEATRRLRREASSAAREGAPRPR